MKKLILVVMFFLSISIASVDVTSFGSGSKNQSIPNIHLKNNDRDLLSFKIYYYFSAADSKDISIDSYYTAGGKISVEKLSANQYRAVLDFENIAVDAGAEFPKNGYLQFGLHYSDWSDWNETDDFSYLNNQSNSLNDRIVVVSSSGSVLAGSFPSEGELDLEPCVVKIYSKSQNENIFGKYQVYAKNEGNIPVNHFDFDIEFTSESGKVPIIEEWHLANATQTIEQKDLNTWILHFSVKNINLEPNSIYPNESGLFFGIRYDDWSKFDSSNDYALADVGGNYEVNEKIPVYVDGKLIFGNPKIHDVVDMKKIIAAENEYTLDEFNKPVNLLIKYLPEVEVTWENLSLIENIVFENVPDFDITSNAFFSILDKFKGLDAMYLARNFKEVKSIYEQLVRLRIVSYFSKFSQKERPLLVKKRYVYITLFDETLTGDEFDALLYNPMRIPGMMRARDFASKWAVEYAKKKFNDENRTGDNRADGFRHAVWNALMCRETGTQFDDISECLNWARRFSNAHEQNNNPYALATVMDLHNNKIGRDSYAPKLRVACEWDWGFACVNEEVVGPSREETKQMYERLADIGVGFNDKAQLEKSPWIRRIVFFKDDNGKYYCRKEEESDCEEFKFPALMAGKIAVLKKDENFTCEEEFSFRLDLEDENNGSRIVDGDANPPGIIVGSGGITFTYCVLKMEDFDYQIPRVSYDYIVLRMDYDCPDGTFAFSRHHDTEDTDNANSPTGTFGPNAITKNAILEYCFVPADENSTLEYPFDASYGVFANYSSSSIVHSQIYTDDEDDDNANSWEYYGAPQDIRDRIAIIMNGSSNTIYYVIKKIELVLNKIVNWIGV